MVFVYIVCGLMITLIVKNSRTSILGADTYALDMIDNVIRYPSEIAIAKEQNIKLDEDLNVWDGWIRFLNKPKTMLPWFPTGLLGYVRSVLYSYNMPYKINDERVRPPDNVPEVVGIPLRDYQLAAAKTSCMHGRGVLDMAPRSGKTRIACEIQRRLATNTLWLAPTREILKQTKRVLDTFFWEDYSYILTGKVSVEEAKKHQVVLCTPNTATMLGSDFYESRDCVIVDEFHRSAAKMYHSIFKNCDHIYYRFGMTGTFFRSGEDIMAMHALISNTLYKVSSADLIDRGFLVPTHTVYLPVDGNLMVSKGAYQVAHGKHGIAEHVYRNQLVAQTAVLLNRTGRSVLILVNTKKQGRIIKDILSGFYTEDYNPVEFVHSGTHEKVLRKTLNSFIDKGEVGILIGTSVLGEGVDLPTADSLVYAMGQKAEVSLVQNAYRVGTAVEGKTHAILVDFADRHHKKLMEHSLERIRVFHNEPTFDIHVLDHYSGFSSWLAKHMYTPY